jgi:catechol 2,3-dioxygenase
MPISSRSTIGHIHLKVADLERSIRFYRDVLGFDLVSRFGSQAAFLSVGGYHHHIGLNTWETNENSMPARNATGLYHFAIRVPNRKALAQALHSLKEQDWPLDGFADHGVSEAIYLTDPDGNGIEIYADRPKSRWPRDRKGNISMYTEPLDVEGLLKNVEIVV